MSTGMLVGLIVGVNLFLVVGGGGLIWFLLRDKRPVAQVSDPLAEKKQADEQARESFMQKIKNMLPGKKNPEQVKSKKEQKETDDAGMLDLSLPDD